MAVPVEALWHRVPGGTARTIHNTLAALVADHPEVNLQAVAAWHRPVARHRATGLGPITYLRMARPVLYESWVRLNWPHVERSVGPVDVAWTPSMIPLPSRAPLVATVNDLGFLDQPEHASRRGRSFFPRVWSAVTERASFIVCPSQEVADQCQRRGVSADRLRVVPWGVSPPLAGPGAVPAVRDRYGLPSTFALWVGTLEPRKNLPRLVEAMIRVPDLPLVVVGPDGWNLDGADVLAPLAGRVHRLGQVDDHTLSALYRAADLLVFPSLIEGFGLPVLEAFAHGTPVVTAADTATAEVAGGAARLVDATDPAHIAAAVAATLTDTEETSRLVAAGRGRARELSWANSARGYARVLGEVAGR